MKKPQNPYSPLSGKRYPPLINMAENISLTQASILGELTDLFINLQSQIKRINKLKKKIEKIDFGRLSISEKRKIDG